jgi:hypothetical protein
VQFTGGVDEGRSEFQRKTLAQEILMNHSPLFDHIAFGHGTWNSELITVDDESLGTPSVEDASQGFRIWLSNELE